MKKIIVIISICILSVSFVLFSANIICRYRDIEFEYVGSVDAGADAVGSMVFPWFSMNDDWPFLLEELYGVRPGDDVGDFDFDNYTYIVTCGHELYKLQYSFGKISGLSACSPQDIHYVGRVFLKYDKADKFYIYRIRRMNISVDNYTGFNDIFFVPPEAEQYN